MKIVVFPKLAFLKIENRYNYALCYLTFGMFIFHMFASFGLNSVTFQMPDNLKGRRELRGMPKGIHTVDLDSRRQTGRDSEIAPTEYKKL